MQTTANDTANTNLTTQHASTCANLIELFHAPPGRTVNRFIEAKKVNYFKG